MKKLFTCLLPILLFSIIHTHLTIANTIIFGQSISGTTWHDINGDGINNGLNSNGSVITEMIELRCGGKPSGGGLINNTIDIGLVGVDVPFSPFAYLTCDGAARNPVCNLNDLDSLQAVQPDFSNLDGPTPLCPGGGGEPTNILWYSFIAGYGYYNIEFELINCTNSSPNITPEIQAGIYLYEPNAQNCWGQQIAPYCEDGCSGGNIILEGSSLIPGLQYLIFLDGCEGSICDYQINILGEFTPYSPDIPTEIIVQGLADSTNLILGDEVTITVQDMLHSYNDMLMHKYRWSLRDELGVVINSWQNDSTNFETSTNELLYTFTELGSYQLCIDEIVDICNNVVQAGFCQDITVIDPFASYITVGGKVWEDSGGSCSYDSTEEKTYQNVSVSIYYENGQSIATTKTDTTGAYSFSVPEGRYLIVLDKENFQPGNILSNQIACGTTANPNNDVPNDNNGYWHPGLFVQTDTIDLITGQEPSGGGLINNTIDFGLIEIYTPYSPYAYLTCEGAAHNPVCDLVVLDSLKFIQPDFPNPIGPNPLCSGYSGMPDKMLWYSFIAGFGDYEIEFIKNGCQIINGIRRFDAGILELNEDSSNCFDGEEIYCYKDSIINTSFSFSNNLLIPGKQYLIWLDSDGESYCGYQINILGNFVPYTPPVPISLTANGSVNTVSTCYDKEVYFEVQDQLDSYKDNPNLTYRWSLNDEFGNIIDDWNTNPTFWETEVNKLDYSFQLAGDYKLCIEEILGDCGSVVQGEICQNIIVSEPEANISGPNPISVGDTTTLSPFGGGTWSSDDPSIAVVNNAGIVTPISEGKVSFTFSDSSTGCLASTELLCITNDTLPSLTNDKICQGDSTSLINYQFFTINNTNPDIVSVDMNGIVTGLMAGTSTLEFLNNGGLVTSITIEVNSKPTVSIAGPPENWKLKKLANIKSLFTTLSTKFFSGGSLFRYLIL